MQDPPPSPNTASRRANLEPERFRSEYQEALASDDTAMLESLEAQLDDLPDQDLDTARALYGDLAASKTASERWVVAHAVHNIARHDAKFGHDLWIQLLGDEDFEVSSGCEENIVGAVKGSLVDAETLAWVITDAFLTLRQADTDS